MSLGPGEIIVVLLVALIVLGPDKLPAAARTFAKYLAEFRKFSAAVQSQVDDVLKMPSTPSEADRGPADDDLDVRAKPDNPDTSGFALIDERSQVVEAKEHEAAIVWEDPHPKAPEPEPHTTGPEDKRPEDNRPE